MNDRPTRFREANRVGLFFVEVRSRYAAPSLWVDRHIAVRRRVFAKICAP